MLKRNQDRRGFTLVELSIVLVIIGLIIGGVLTGKQIMQNAEVTNAVNSIQAYQAQFQTYVQNYGAMPGDDANATTRFSTSTIIANGSGNGTLDGYFDSVTDTDETRKLWADLRAAGLVKGTISTAQPSNPFGGIYGFQHTAFISGSGGNSGITTNVLCLNDVPGDAAGAIDSRLDDGNSNGGSVQGFVPVTGSIGESATATAATSYVSGSTYTLCVGM